jgi:hypothetical protein
MQLEVADVRSGMKMRDKLVFREGNNKHRCLKIHLYCEHGMIFAKGVPPGKKGMNAKFIIGLGSLQLHKLPWDIADRTYWPLFGVFSLSLCQECTNTGSKDLQQPHSLTESLYSKNLCVYL